MDFLLICEDRLNPCYFSLHSGMEALSRSQENKPAATVQRPKSLVCRDEDSGEQGSNSRKDHQGEDHSTQSLSKASHLLWIQHRDSMMKHQNKESRNTDKASPQQWVFNRALSSESSKTPGSPEQKAEMCNSKPHRHESYFQRALYYKKHKSQWMCKIHSMRLVSSLLGKLLFSSLFPAYCWKRDCQNNDTSS